MLFGGRDFLDNFDPGLGVHLRLQVCDHHCGRFKVQAPDASQQGYLHVRISIQVLAELLELRIRGRVLWGPYGEAQLREVVEAIVMRYLLQTSCVIYLVAVSIEGS